MNILNAVLEKLLNISRNSFTLPKIFWSILSTGLLKVLRLRNNLSNHPLDALKSMELNSRFLFLHSALKIFSVYDLIWNVEIAWPTFSFRESIYLKYFPFLEMSQLLCFSKFPLVIFVNFPLAYSSLEWGTVKTLVIALIFPFNAYTLAIYNLKVTVQ